MGMFDKILEAKGAISNAATSKDFTHYYISHMHRFSIKCVFCIRSINSAPK